MAMMSNSSALETELNMFVRSTNTAALVGVVSFRSGWSMNRSMDRCILLMMKSIPFGIPTAKL